MTPASDPTVEEFIRSTFRSVWSIELLCVLRKEPIVDRSAADLVAALHASDLVVSQGVAALSAAGLVVVNSDGSVRYQPASPALDLLASGSIDLYARSPGAVRRLVVDSAATGLTAFADAFKIRRD